MSEYTGTEAQNSLIATEIMGWGDNQKIISILPGGIREEGYADETFDHPFAPNKCWHCAGVLLEQLQELGWPQLELHYLPTLKQYEAQLGELQRHGIQMYQISGSGETRKEAIAAAAWELARQREGNAAIYSGKPNDASMVIYGWGKE